MFNWPIFLFPHYLSAVSGLGFYRKLNDETWMELMRRDGFYHSAFVLQKPYKKQKNIS